MKWILMYAKQTNNQPTKNTNTHRYVCVCVDNVRNTSERMRIRNRNRFEKTIKNIHIDNIYTHTNK